MQWTKTIWNFFGKAQEMNILAKFHQIWPSGFRGSDWKVDNRLLKDARTFCGSGDLKSFPISVDNKRGYLKLNSLLHFLLYFTTEKRYGNSNFGNLSSDWFQNIHTFIIVEYLFFSYYSLN